MIRIHIGGEWLNLDQVIESFRSPSDQQEARAIQLIKEWQSGAREFTFQTSGSTGTPGRKVFSREQLEASALLTERALKLKPGYTTLICLDVNFIAGGHDDHPVAGDQNEYDHSGTCFRSIAWNERTR